jgi:ubiquinone/menaquinone biosynthesis C-methylase UbiE
MGKHRFYDHYSFSMIPLLGTVLAGDCASYQYLVESSRRFQGQGDFSRMIAEAGFTIMGIVKVMVGHGGIYGVGLRVPTPV